LVKRKEFWLIVSLLFLGTSTGQLYINTLGSIYISLGGKNGDQNLSVILISVMNAAGRMSSGLITDKLSHKMKRTTYLIVIYFIMFLHWALLGAFGNLHILPLSSIIVGFCYGSTLCILPTITSELFGVCTFAENWGSIQPFNAVGGVLLAGLAGHIYQAQIPASSHSNICVGHSCYSYTFLLLAGLCFISFILCSILNSLLPPVSTARKHVLFPKLPHHISIFQLSFLHPFHHHHPRIKPKQGKKPVIYNNEIREK